MKPTKVFIYSNDTGLSKATANELINVLSSRKFEISSKYDETVDLIACIGGDGTFLNCVHECRLPRTPIIGINTGHLGFFQELVPSELEMFVNHYNDGNYTVEKIHPIRALITDRDGIHEITGINEILVMGMYTKLAHLSIIMDDTPIQEFIGDGILVSTPVGSTAYNYSLGGSLVAPELDALQLTPMAPMNTSAYRCFRSSILYPASKNVRLVTRKSTVGDKLLLAYDGLTREFSNVSKIDVMQADDEIHLIRLPGYDYWNKLTNKLL